MYKRILTLMAVMMLVVAPLSLAIAGEHGGKEHGGGAKSHGAGSHGEMGHEDSSITPSQKRTIVEAANALRGSNPGLASRLDGIVGAKAKEHGGKSPGANEHGGKEHGGE